MWRRTETSRMSLVPRPARKHARLPLMMGPLVSQDASDGVPSLATGAPALRSPGALVVSAMLFAFGFASESAAWDRGGHYLVGAVAWEGMSESARAESVRLMLQAPHDSDLPGLWSLEISEPESRARGFFVRAANWADLVKDRGLPDRQARYDRFDWHFVNWFWRPTPQGPLYLESRRRFGQLLHQLERLQQSVVASKRPPRARGLDVAWIVHLVGDVHQPLHASARVTSEEPDGDRGGNDFPLAFGDASNLHAYWDTALSRGYPRRPDRSLTQWAVETAEALLQEHPRTDFEEELERVSFEEWSWYGAQFAMRSAFPPELVRGGSPPSSYEAMALLESKRRVVLAGYRLADKLNQWLGASREVR